MSPRRLKTHRRIRTRIVKTIVTVNIRAPVELAFDFVTAADSMPKWQPRVVGAWYSPTESPTVGSVMHVATSNRGTHRQTEWQFLVTRFEPVRAMSLTGSRWPFEFQNSIELHRNALATRVRFELQVSARQWVARLLVRLLARRFTRRLVRALRSAKTQLEQSSRSQG